MMLDAATIDALELVRPNTRAGACAGGAGGSKGRARGATSLLSFLDQTSTVPGARLLRTNVLQPLTSVATLVMRQDAVQELLESPHLALQLVELLEQRLPKNLDRVGCLGPQNVLSRGSSQAAQLRMLATICCW